MRLIHGDCLEVLRTLPDGCADAVIADPPYGTTACKWDAVIPLAPMWEQLRRVAKPNAAIVLTSAQPFTSALVMSNPREFRYDWSWDKVNRITGFLDAKRKPLRRHESVLVFYRRLPTYNPQMVAGEPYHAQRSTTRPAAYAAHEIRDTVNDGTRYPTSVLPFKGDRKDTVHPTQKPVDLMAYLIRTYTNPGETVLDFCMGSGTTGVACQQEGRDFIGIERDAGYFAIAGRRIAAAQPPLFAEAAD